MSASSFSIHDTFAKRIKWSPDAELIISSLDDGRIKIFDNKLSEIAQLEGNCINDFEWYPWMSWSSFSGCCFVAVSKDLPIHLWNVKDEQSLVPSVRSSWCPRDHLDQISTCHSVTISPEGRYVVSGGNSSIWCFDITRPGSESLIPRSTVSSRKRKDGQTGIISNIVFRNDTSNVFAACSFEGSVGIYDLRSMQNRVEEKSSSCMKFKAHQYGASQSKFLLDGWSLVTAGRKDDMLKIWDLRKLNDEAFGPVRENCLSGSDSSNQRIYFDTTSDNSVITGSGTNVVKFRGEDPSVLASGHCLISSVSVNCHSQVAYSDGTRPSRNVDDEISSCTEHRINIL